MRAREFITEQEKLPPELADPMNHVFVLPGVQASDPYQMYRLSVAMARARSDTGTDGLTDKLPAWSAESPFGEEGVVAGFDASVEPIIDQALAMAGLPGKKVQISSPNSLEPASVNHTSPVKPFNGY